MRGIMPNRTDSRKFFALTPQGKPVGDILPITLRVRKILVNRKSYLI